MRQFLVADDAYDDDDSPRVVPIRPGSGGRAGGARPAPWTPRDLDVPAAPRRQAAISPEPARGTNVTRLMLGGFAIVAIGMVLGLVLVRLWDDASRAVAALPPEGTAVQPAGRAAPPAGPAAGAPAAPASAGPLPVAQPAGSGAIVTEIRVLQPNYTVAPGDTLGSIARKHGTSIDALASINNLENRNALGVGQKLIIP